MESNNNQEKQGWGGKREGAGRPKGSGHKPKMADDLTEEQKKELLEKSLSQAIAGDSRLQVFFLEQIYGKAKQQLGLDGGEDEQGNMLPVLVKFIEHGNDHRDSDRV